LRFFCVFRANETLLKMQPGAQVEDLPASLSRLNGQERLSMAAIPIIALGEFEPSFQSVLQQEHVMVRVRMIRGTAEESVAKWQRLSILIFLRSLVFEGEAPNHLRNQAGAPAAAWGTGVGRTWRMTQRR